MAKAEEDNTNLEKKYNYESKILKKYFYKTHKKCAILQELTKCLFLWDENAGDSKRKWGKSN